MTEQTKTLSNYTWSFCIAFGTTFTIWVLLFSTAICFPLDDRGSVVYASTADMGSDPASSIILINPVEARYQPEPPKTVPFDTTRFKRGSLDLPLDAPPLAKTTRAEEPDQIHISLAGTGAMFVSWVTGDARVVDSLPENITRPHPESVVAYFTEDEPTGKIALGETVSYEQVYPGATYISGSIHHVKLTGLDSNTTYSFTCGDPRVAVSEVLSFRTPQAPGPEAFPQRIGLIGDLGQTHNSSSTLEHVLQSDPPVVLLVGDMAYADNYNPDGTLRPPGAPVTTAWHPTYQPRWDSWARFVQPLASKVPMMVLEGNHEIERDAANATFQAFTHRFRVPYVESNSPSPLFYSFDLAGAHIVVLGTYTCGSGSCKYADFGPDSEQQRWLRGDLAAFSRDRTPWLIVAMHAPWQNTYEAHYKEAECMKQALEPLLYKHGVDVIFTGHVHAYERSNRVYKYKVDPCGPIHITIGDGGNIEKLYTSWVDTYPGVCPTPNPESCPTYQEGEFCPAAQPPWSAFRHPSFGHGILELLTPTEAVWTWHANEDSIMVASDTVKITRSLECANQAPGVQ